MSEDLVTNRPVAAPFFGRGPGSDRLAQPIGIRVITAYKIFKAIAEVALGVALLSLGASDAADDLRRIVRHLAHHATEAWSIALVSRLLRAITARRVVIVAWASICDGALSAFEAWALKRRYAWSRWFIVGATSCALPFEIVALVRRPRAGRFVLLLLNIAIVVYLVSHRLRGGQTERPRGAWGRG